MEARGASDMVTAVGDLTLGEVGVNALPTLWGDIEPLLAEACSYSPDGMTPSTIVDQMFEGKARMLALADEKVRSIMVVTVEAFPSGLRVLLCLMASGVDFKTMWLPHEDELKDFAREFGCTKARLIGRKGWKKMLPHWRLVGEVLEVAI